MTKSVGFTRINEVSVGYQCDYTIYREPITCPTKESTVHVVSFGLLRGAGRDVRVLDALVDGRVLAVLVVFVFVQLIGVIRRIADDDTDPLIVLALDACDVFFADAAE